MELNEKREIESAIRLLEAENNCDGLGQDGSVALDILHKLLPQHSDQQKLITQVTLAMAKISSLAVENGLDTPDGENWYIETPKKITPETLGKLLQVNGILP